MGSTTWADATEPSGGYGLVPATFQGVVDDGEVDVVVGATVDVVVVGGSDDLG